MLRQREWTMNDDVADVDNETRMMTNHNMMDDGDDEDDVDNDEDDGDLVS